MRRLNATSTMPTSARVRPAQSGRGWVGFIRPSLGWWGGRLRPLPPAQPALRHRRARRHERPARADRDRAARDRAGAAHRGRRRRGSRASTTMRPTVADAVADARRGLRPSRPARRALESAQHALGMSGRARPTVDVPGRGHRGCRGRPRGARRHDHRPAAADAPRRARRRRRRRRAHRRRARPPDRACRRSPRVPSPCAARPPHRRRSAPSSRATACTRRMPRGRSATDRSSSAPPTSSSGSSRATAIAHRAPHAAGSSAADRAA